LEADAEPLPRDTDNLNLRRQVTVLKGRPKLHPTWICRDLATAGRTWGQPAQSGRVARKVDIGEMKRDQACPMRRENPCFAHKKQGTVRVLSLIAVVV